MGENWNTGREVFLTTSFASAIINGYIINMTVQNLTILRTLKERLAASVKVFDVRAFGSRARGDNDPESDLDVLVVVERSDKKTKEIVRHLAWEIGFEAGLIISTLVLSDHDLHNSPLKESPIVHNIAAEGVSV